MRITALHIANFKRAEDIRIEPDADRTIILLGGKNKQGKSSTLDALTAAFGGKSAAPSDPVRHGAAEAEINVELDGGELTIRRVIQPDGESVLEVRDRLGAIKSPQATLDKLVGTRFLDPLRFLALPAKEQRAQLMRLIGEADRIAQLDAKRERAFAKRTEVGRDLTKAEGELARLPVVEVGTPIDVAELTLAAQTSAAEQREIDRLGNRKSSAATDATSAQMRVDKTKAEIVELERKLREARGLLERDERELAAALQAEESARAAFASAEDAWAKSAARRDQVSTDIARADAHNRAVYAREAQNARRAEVAKAVEALKTERDNISKAITAIDQRKAEILAAAKLPVDGLGVDEEGVTLGGVPLAQASGAERFRVALALAIAASPGLDDVWIRDAAVLDDDHLAMIAEQAAALGKRPWLERVGTNDPGVIVIANGKVAS